MSLGNKKENLEKRKFVTPKARAAYPHLFKPQGMKGTPPESHKFSIVLLVPKSSEDINLYKTAIKNAKVDEYGPNKDKWPKSLLSPISDGDDPMYAERQGYKGHWAIKATSNQNNKPGVVDEELQPILDASGLYPGCYVRAQIFARAWEFAGKRGVQFILDHVQKMGDGKPFGGKKSADQVFAPVTSDDDEDEVAEDDDDDFM